MRVLVVCSGNHNHIAPFIAEQVDSISKNGCLVEYFLINGHSLKGYISNLKYLKKKIIDFKPDLIHAHYGLSGLLANLQSKVPVITTYHGSDINQKWVVLFSKISILLSKQNIFVSKMLLEKSGCAKTSIVIPCGVDVSIFKPMDKQISRESLGLALNKNYILFSSAFDNKVKNVDLANKALIDIQNVDLIELKAYSREQVAMLMNAVDCCLMTSQNEGSPQFIKEAMACNCPVVTVDVGDVKERLNGVTNSYVTTKYPEEIKDAIMKVLKANKRSNGNEIISQQGLLLQNIATLLLNIYNQVVNASTK